MKILKRVLFFLLILFTFTFTFSQDNGKITIFEKRNEPSKLKIGVTKIKTKELEMHFDAEKKLIYSELPVDISDNNIVFVSENLEEMPSLFTTNGRKSINNIKKYLTKNIKKAPKFSYKVVVGDKKNGIREGKRYLLINCKAPLSNVYVYSVEKENYHVKNVYRGNFNFSSTLEEIEANVSYGTINITDKVGFTGNNITISSDNGQNITINDKSQDKSVAYITNGSFPSKFYTKEPQGFDKTRVKITLGTGTSAENNNFDFPTGAYDITLPLRNTKQRSLNEKIQFIATQDSDYIKIKLIDWDRKSSMDSSVKVEYFGTKNGKESLIRTDIYKLSIAPHTDSEEETQGVIEVGKNHEFNSNEKTLSYDGKTIKVDNIPVEYINISGKYPKKFSKASILQIIQNEIIVQDNINLGEKGEFTSTIFSLQRASKVGESIGTLQIVADDGEYLKFKIKIDKKFRDDTNNNIKLRYLIKDVSSGKYSILKTDEIQLSISKKQEKILEDTRGGIFINNAGGLNHDLLTSLEGRKITSLESGDEYQFPSENATIIGDFPKKIEIDKESVDWGDEQRVFISNESEEGARTGFYNISSDALFETKFSDQDKDALQLSTDSDHTSVPSINFIKTKDVNIGIKTTKDYDYLIFEIYDYNIDAKTILNKTMKLEYQAKIDGEWITKKTDRLRVIIQPQKNAVYIPQIDIKETPVWYDKSSFSKNTHYRRVKLLGGTANTLNRDQSLFKKNGSWISVRDVPEYSYNYKHKIEINADNAEVVKTTDSNGGTLSSTFIDIGNGNEVMLAYDGSGDKSLSFGLAKYNFNGGSGKIFISHYDSNNSITSTHEYHINITPFDPLPYLDENLDIHQNKDYIKDYTFKQDISNNSIEIDLGRVGLRDLDTRITEQNGGEGIEICATTDVLLVGEGEYSNYKIPAKLYFDKKDDTKEVNRDGEKYSVLKGKSEEKVQGELKLKISSQEYLITKSKFKIVEASDETKSPLRVGVVVNGNDKKYFKEITDLYINVTEQRFIKTELVFENTKIQTEASSENSNGMYWIKLNKSSYSAGKIIEEYEGSSWGRVQEEVIDIPNEELKGKELVVEVYDRSYKKVSNNINSGKSLSLTLAENKFELKLNSNQNNYIEFRLNNNNNNNNNNNKGEYSIGDDYFYLRFLVKDSNGATQYLFTQQYKVRFEKIAGIIGKLNINLKNPMMYIEKEDFNTGELIVDKTNNFTGSALGNGNHNTTQDAQIWWSVSGALDFPNTDSYEYKFYSDQSFSSQILGDSYKGVKLKFRKNNNSNFSSLVIGLNEDFKFNDRLNSEIIYVEFTKKDKQEDKKKYLLTISIDDFDPKYYGKIYSAQEIDDTGRNNYRVQNSVGSGTEQLKRDNESAYHYIDLDSIYRDYQRYIGAMKLLGVESLEVFGLENLKAVAEGESVPAIEGKLVFKEINDSSEILNVEKQEDKEYLEKIIVEPMKISSESLKTPKKYKLYFKVDSENYKKLLGKVKYKIQSSNSNDKNVIQIKATENYFDKINLKDYLNFATSAEPFVISTNILDFGKINIASIKDKELRKYAATTISLSGENLEDITLTLEGNSHDGDGDYEIVISQYDSNGQIANSDTLLINNIRLDQISLNTNKNDENYQSKVYNLGGSLIVPKTSKTGSYQGTIYINTTISN